MNKNFSKFTLNIDQNDPIALSIAKSVEGALKRALEPLQQEGQKVLRSSRSYSDNGLRATDYYVESKYADLARQVAEEYISAQSDARGRDVRASFSPTTSSAFSVQRSTILDPAKRAALARTVIDNGGFFNRGNDGMVEWGVDSALRATSGTGREIPLTRQIRSSISSSNAAYRGRFEGLMKTVTGNDYSFSGYSEAERAALMRGARGVQMEGDRTQLNMLRARKRYEAKQQYAAAHPDDPLVRAARKRQSKKNAAKMASAARFARNAVAYTVTAILGSVMSVIGVLNKISDKITEIGETTRRQAMTDARYNLPAGTVRNWEVFASKRVDVGKDLLSNAVNEIAQQFSSPLNYSKSNIEKIAPWLKEGTRNLMKQGSSSGDPNAMGIVSAMLDDLFEASIRGEAGTKTRLSRGQAFSENIQMLLQQYPSLGELAEIRRRDFEKSGAKTIADWTQEGIDGKTYSMIAERWLTQGGWAKGYSERSAPISSEAARAGSEETAETWANLKGTTAELVRQIFESVFGGSKFAQLAEDIRAFLSVTLSKWFPQFASKENSRAMQENAASAAVVNKSIVWKKAEADRVAVSMGYKNADAMIGDLNKLGDNDKKFLSALSPEQKAAFADPENMVALASYFTDENALAMLDEESKKEVQKVIVVGDEAQRATDSGNRASKWVLNAVRSQTSGTAQVGLSGMFEYLDKGIARYLNDPENAEYKQIISTEIDNALSGTTKLQTKPGLFTKKAYKNNFDAIMQATLMQYDLNHELSKTDTTGEASKKAQNALDRAKYFMSRYGVWAGYSEKYVEDYPALLANHLKRVTDVEAAGGKITMAGEAAAKVVQLQDLEVLKEQLYNTIGYDAATFAGMKGVTMTADVLNENEALGAASSPTTFTYVQNVNGVEKFRRTVTLPSPFKRDVTVTENSDANQVFSDAMSPQ